MYDGHYYGTLGDGGYKATHRGAPRHVSQRITPNFEKKEGLRFGLFQPAKYLPSVRLEVLNHDHFVIAAGSPCALDSNGFAVPAGYRLILAAGAGQGPQYTEADRIAGTLNASGVLVSAGEYVVDSMLAEGIEIGRCIGVASYDVYQNLNDDVHNPGTYKYHNYNKQNGFSILTTYLLEFPVEPLKRSAGQVTIASAGSALTTVDLLHDSVVRVVEVKVNKDRVADFTLNKGAGAGGVDRVDGLSIEAGDEVEINYVYEEAFYSSPFSGMTTWRGDAKTHGLVTYNAESKFVLYQESALDDSDLASLAASVDAKLDERLDIVGIVTDFDNKFPKQVLDQVQTAYDTRLHSPIVDPETGLYTDGTGLDKMPGSATDGVPHSIQYAGGDLQTGVVTFKLRL